MVRVILPIHVGEASKFDMSGAQLSQESNNDIGEGMWGRKIAF